ncbi:MAG TPA: efflux RND transporter periplasmic adaptor subunit [Thermoanaerobaculia bacterium]|nr:efflux RND transporter periplasmic adaptor subunit [Thermoanaerobaculia bacterium]HUM28967.1 efflux RND transporter periplasmic adaptor subunit [Thermoanaerobaculia bacterium]HXK67101.1 efflux RND transporter periplasmic adaptor subunit [Thermoanaerobaculia bacterium]
MKTLFRVFFGLIALGAISGIFFFVTNNAGAKQTPYTLQEIQRGTIVDKALAVGQIVPDQEVQVKSQISGIVKRCYVEVGDTVRTGDPLFEITPDPTPLQLTEAERNVEIADVSFNKARADFLRKQKLLDNGILSREEYDVAKETYDQAEIQLSLARERFQLIKEGKIKKASGGVDSVIRAPASGTVLQRPVNPGDPVVPLTSYQAGTVMMTIADMGSLLFKGTVDEIDVGKLRESLPVRIRVGALPNATITGQLAKIAPKATEDEGTTVFDVEASIQDRGDAYLRAGYSANAEIIIQEKADVLILPERLLLFEDDATFVEVPSEDPEAEPVKKKVTLGLSDGLNVEVVEGLNEGDQVVQRPPREIE